MNTKSIFIASKDFMEGPKFNHIRKTRFEFLGLGGAYVTSTIVCYLMRKSFLHIYMEYLIL